MVDVACYTRCFDHCENKALLMIHAEQGRIIKLCACVGHIRLDIITPNNDTVIELYGDGDYRKNFYPARSMLVAGVDYRPEQRQAYLKLFTDYYYDMINTEKHKYSLVTLEHFYLYPTPDDIESLQPKRKGVDLSEFAWC